MTESTEDSLDRDDIKAQNPGELRGTPIKVEPATVNLPPTRATALSAFPTIDLSHISRKFIGFKRQHLADHLGGSVQGLYTAYVINATLFKYSLTSGLGMKLASASPLLWREI